MPDTALISPFADMMLQRGKIPSEGNAKYLDKNSHVFPKNANLKLKGRNPK